MHDIDSDVHTMDSEELILEAGSGGSIEAAMERAGSRSVDGPGSAPISAIVPQEISGCCGVTGWLDVDFYASMSMQGHR
jgi:hypothetical protein